MRNASLVFLRLLLFCIALLPGGTAMATNSPVLRDLAVLVDPQGDMNIAAVASTAVDRFTPLPAGLAAGYTRNAHWLRFTITAPVGEYWLDVLPPNLDDLRFYEPDPIRPGAYLEHRAGDRLPFDAREADYRGFIFKLRPVDERPRTYFLRLQTTSTSVLVLRLWKPDHFYTAMALEYGALIGILSVLLVVMVLHLISGLWMHDSLVRWFIVFVGNMWLFFLCSSGFAAQYLIPDLPQISDAMATLTAFLVIAVAHVFYPRLFGVTPKQRLVFNLYRFCTVLALAACVSWFTGHFVQVAPLSFIYALLMTGVGSWNAWCLWRVRDAGSGMIFLSNLFSMLGFLIIILNVLGVFASNYATLYSMQLTSLGLIISLHLALNARHRALLEAHRQAAEDSQRALHEMQRDRELHERQGRFIDFIAHEYRTPLTILRTNLDILGLSKDEVQRQTSVNSMRIAVKRLADIFNFSQSTDDWGGHRSLRLQPLLPADLLRALIAEANATVNAARHKYVLDCDNDAVRVMADPELLKTVLRNLFDNAQKYARVGSTIAIHVMALADVDSVIIAIANHCATSPGSDPQSLMGKGVRGANSDGADGVGMGLYIVKKLMEDMGGETTIRLDKPDYFEIMLRLPRYRYLVEPSE